MIFPDRGRNVAFMEKRPFLTRFAVVSATLVLFSAPVHAACYADYKAKRENPLNLHYGVIKIDSNPCAMSDRVRSIVASRVGAAGWELLQVQSVFDDSGLERRRKDAGQFFLRF